MASAARIRWAKFRVAAVTVAATLILLTLLYLLFGTALLSQKSLVYLWVPDGTGLSTGSPVRVDGIQVGRVSSVELSGSNQPSRVVKVTLQIYKDRLSAIPSDSLAQISIDSLIGDKFVDINSGRSATAVVNGSEITYKDQPELLRSLDLTQFTQQLRLLDATLTDIETGRSQFGQFYQGTDFYRDLQARLVNLQTAFHGAVSTTSAVGAFIETDALHRQVSESLQRIDRTIAQIQAGQGPAGKMLRDPAQYDQLLAAARSFRQQVASYGSSPLLQSDALYQNLTQSLAAWIKRVDDFNLNPEMATTSTYENLNGSLDELRTFLRDIRLNPRKYLRLKVF